MHDPRQQHAVSGAGIGLRRSMIDEFLEQPSIPVDFMEVAPENWIGIGGRFGRELRMFTERYPFVVHGLSLSLGGPDELDTNLVHAIKSFMDEHGIRLYSEHLSYCSSEGQLYDLMPIPFTEDAVHHVASRIQRVQDIIGQTMAIENVSYYAAQPGEMSEIEFLLAVLEEADCQLLLDVNNIYVNSVNHRYDAEGFLRAIPGERIAYVHVAGHFKEAEDLIIDTHGADVTDPVWKLLKQAYALFGLLPTLLERDFDIPPYAALMREVDVIRSLQSGHVPHSIPVAQHA